MQEQTVEEKWVRGGLYRVNTDNTLNTRTISYNFLIFVNSGFDHKNSFNAYCIANLDSFSRVTNNMKKYNSVRNAVIKCAENVTVFNLFTDKNM